jgi:hypothetical protein
MKCLSLIFSLLIILANCTAQKKQGTADSKKQEIQNQAGNNNQERENRILPGAERIKCLSATDTGESELAFLLIKLPWSAIHIWSTR